MTTTKRHRPTNCIICSKLLPIASTGRIRFTCSDRCRQIKQRYGNWADWRDTVETRNRERYVETFLRRTERKVGSLDFLYHPAHPDLTMRTMVKRTLMRYREVRECGNCGRPFVPKGYRWQYWDMCSDRCAESFARYAKRVADNFYANPRRMPDEVNDWIRRHKRMTLCAHCDEPFVPRNRRKYCSDKCKDAAYWKRRPLRRCKGCGEMYRGRTMACSDRCREIAYRCRCCRKACRKAISHKAIQPRLGTSFDASIKLAAGCRTPRPVVFCSEECRDSLGWMFIPKQCEWCEQSYAPKAHYDRSQYCSVRCKDKARTHRRREERRALREAQPRLCRECGEVIPDPLMFGVYCSDDCLTEAKRRQQRNAQQRFRERQRQAREAARDVAREAAKMPIPIPVGWPGARVMVASPP